MHNTITKGFAMHDHTIRVDTHRAQVMPLDTDEHCAAEGAHPAHRRNNQGHPIAKVPRPLKVREVSDESPPPAGPGYWLVVAVSLVSFSIFLGWHVLASFGPEIAKLLGVGA